MLGQKPNRAITLNYVRCNWDFIRESAPLVISRNFILDNSYFRIWRRDWVASMVWFLNHFANIFIMMKTPSNNHLPTMKPLSYPDMKLVARTSHLKLKTLSPCINISTLLQPLKPIPLDTFPMHTHKCENSM